MEFIQSFSQRKGPTYVAGVRVGILAAAYAFSRRCLELEYEDTEIAVLFGIPLNAIQTAKCLGGHFDAQATNMFKDQIAGILSENFKNILSQFTINEMAQKECCEIKEWLLSNPRLQ